MAITPDTNVFLLKSPLQLSNKNQLTFNNKTEQFTYFYNLPKIEIEKANFQRKDSIIRFPAHIDTILEYNYCMYQNSNYGDKWFYAFITNMRYVANNNTEISIVTDVFQTWQFDFNFKESFVEREHISVNDDIPGANLVPEGLEFGEPIQQQAIDVDDLQPYYVVAFTGDSLESEIEYLNLSPSLVPFHKLNGIPTGVNMFIGTLTGVENLLREISMDAKTEMVMTIFTVPKLAVNLGNQQFGQWNNNNIPNTGNPVSPKRLSLPQKPSSLNGYIPRNKKLLTYPYCYCGFTSPLGTKQIFKFEDFMQNIPQFDIISEVNQNPTVVFIPLNYKGIEEANVTEGVSIQGYPTISYKTEYFNTWLAQNSNIINLQMEQEQFNYEIDAIQRGANIGGNIVDKAFNLDVGGALMEGANAGFDLAKMNVNHEYYIKMQMAQIEKQKMLPNSGTLGSSNATLIGYDYLKENIFSYFAIKPQFAQKLDKYFDMYGYLTNERKIPNLNNRPTWNYIKTIGANILGNIPQTDMEILKNMFNQGITLWHNSENFLDYSINNR